MKYIIYILLLFNTLFAFKPIVKLEADKQNIYLGEKVKLILSVIVPKSDENKIKFIHKEDIEGLKILKRGGNTSYDTIADKNETLDIVEKDIFYTISPKKNLIINPLSLFINDKEYKTNRIKIKIIKDTIKNNVTEQKEKKSKHIKTINLKKAIKINLKANKRSLTIYEPLILTLIVKYPLNAPIKNITIKDPIFKDFILVKKIKKDNYLKNDLLTTIKYILIPKKSGTLNILPAKINFTLSHNSDIVVPFGFINPTINLAEESIKSNSLKIDIFSIPKNIDIVGNYKIENKINKKIANENEQIIYDITIKGEGNLEELELPKMNIDNVTTYQNNPEIEKKLVGDKFLTIYKQKYVFISNESFTIPSLKIKAYSPRFKKIYTLSTKEIDILINKHKVNRLIDVNSKKDINKQIANHTNVVLDINYYKKKIDSINSSKNNVLFFILGFILGGILILLIPKIIKFSKFKNKDIKSFSSYQEAFNILYPHTTKNKEYENMVTDLYEIINGNRDIKIDDKKLNSLINKIKKESI